MALEYDMLTSGRYFILNRRIAIKLGTEAAFVLTELSEEEECCTMAGTIDSDGYFRSAGESCLTESERESDLKALEESGILEIREDGCFRLRQEPFMALMMDDSQRNQEEVTLKKVEGQNGKKWVLKLELYQE